MAKPPPKGAYTVAVFLHPDISYSYMRMILLSLFALGACSLIEAEETGVARVSIGDPVDIVISSLGHP